MSVQKLTDAGKKSDDADDGVWGDVKWLRGVDELVEVVRDERDDVETERGSDIRSTVG